ncbi:hypothetical protein LOD99_102 [Oopsacas minuta]|uniref:Uncharacterized protein n=1 Tax=Oopsacas minuta TaxID=111878 RepID=A0AAV7K9N5_9METZ|nr:hypothetical protein LOD99_102 [Oopsacas minuta]
MNVKARFDAQALLSGLIKYETILVAHIYLRLFQVTTPLSEYLQTSGLDFIQAQGMTVTTMESLRRMEDEFESIILTANKFIESQNEKLELLDCDIFLIIHFLLEDTERKI